LGPGDSLAVIPAKGYQPAPESIIERVDTQLGFWALGL